MLACGRERERSNGEAVKDTLRTDELDIQNVVGIEFESAQSVRKHSACVRALSTVGLRIAGPTVNTPSGYVIQIVGTTWSHSGVV
jgi:hypothetical protein